jgi:hypothetical protein
MWDEMLHALTQGLKVTAVIVRGTHLQVHLAKRAVLTLDGSRVLRKAWVDSSSSNRFGSTFALLASKWAVCNHM